MKTNNLQDEVWVDVADFEGLYQVSNLGRVKSLARKVKHKTSGFISVKERILIPNLDKVTGYYKYILSKNSKYTQISMHRLIASHFIENSLGLAYVNHKDGNKTNNSIENLEWCSGVENARHARRTGLVADMTRESKLRVANSKAKLSEADVNDIRSSSLAVKELAAKYGICISQAYRVRRGGAWAWAY